MKRYRARLIKLNEFGANDFGMSESEYEKLLSYEGTLVTVYCEATDGYFDCTTDDGFEIVALSSYHLDKVNK